MGFLISSPVSILNYKRAARAASTANELLSSILPIMIDNISLAHLDRVLLKNQTAPAENGIYEVIVVGGNYSLARTSDANSSSSFKLNMAVAISEGTVNADKVFQINSDVLIDLGTTAITFLAVDSAALAAVAAEQARAVAAEALALQKSSNLSDLASVGTAKTNLSLQNVDNTSDANKPVSTAQQTALNLKADLISPVFTTPNIGSATGSISGNAATVTTNADLTGPVTSVGNATAIANSAISNAMLANAAVANLSGTNTGDNAAASLVPSQASQANKVLATDGTTTSWQYAGLGSGGFGTGNVFLGAPPLGITSATYNTIIGETYPVRALTSAIGNTALGVNTLIYNTTGDANTAIGRNTLYTNVNGAYNVAVGDGSLQANDIASFNVGIGYAALQANNGNNPNNVAIGGYALHVNVGTKNVALGHYAGRYATTASEEFYLDNQSRGSNAAEKTSGLMFGTFNANPALQTLAINAAVTTPYTISGSNLSGTNTGDQTNISGNAATVTTNANLTGPVTSSGNATAIANSAISNAMLANAAVANLSGTNTGDNSVNSLYTANPMTTAGDLIVGGASGAQDRLGAGAANKVLATDGTTSSWQYAGLGSGGFGSGNLILGRAKPTGLTGTNNSIAGDLAGDSATSAFRLNCFGYRAGFAQTTSSYSVYIGAYAGDVSALGSYNVAVGDVSMYSQTAGISSATCLGFSTSASGDSAVSIGASAQGSGIALGAGSTSGGNASTIVIGRGAVPDYYVPANGLSIGSTAYPIYTIFLYSASHDTQIRTSLISADPNSSAAAKTLTLSGSQGTGTGLGSDVIISTSPAGASGSNTNAYVERLRVTADGKVNVSADLNTTAYTEAVIAIGNTGAAQTLVISSGTVQTATLDANCTFTMPTATAGKSFTLYLRQDGTGSWTATFTSVKWNSTGAPTITVTANKMDILSFVADGTNWYGSYQQGYTP